MTKHDPFVTPGTNPVVKQLKKGETDTIELKIKPHGTFGKSKGFQYTTYKYTFCVRPTYL